MPKSVSALAVFTRMVEKDDHTFKLAPLSNIIGARKVKQGTQVTIGVGADICTQIMANSLVGGFIFCDRQRFNEVKAQMEAEP